MKKILMLVVLAAISLLMGCSTMEQQPQPTQFRNVFVKPSAALTKDCPVSAPPDKAAFMAASEKERIKMLGAADLMLQGDLKNCNDQWQTLRDWYVQQEAIHTKNNPK